MAIPPARGGRALPVKPRVTKPKAPKAPRVKPIDPNQVATSNAMSAFRTALQQLQASTPQVDANAIYAPYRASQAVTGQLGQGLQTAVTNAGQAAQTQYGAGLAEAQKSAAQFGIAAGSGAQPTALQNNGTQLISQQTQAQAAAAPQAATAWQQLLERSAAAKVSDANLQRQNSLTSAQQQLSAGLPGAIQNEKQLGFQQDTARKNFALAVGTQKDRATNDLRDYLLGVQKTQTSAATAAANTGVKKQALAQKTKNDAAKLRVSQQALALKKRGTSASAKGLKGISGAVKALSGTSTSGSKPVTGYKVTYLADPDGISAGGPPVTLTVRDPKTAQPPSGYVKPKDSVGQPVYGQAGAKTTAGITRSAWDTQMRALLAQNPGQAAAIRAFLGPRPKK